jgi:hypothetical protein
MPEESWRKAIIRVLAESDSPLHYGEITERILARGYFETAGAAPKNIVASEIVTSMKAEGDSSPFIKVARGIYALRSGALSHDPILAANQPERAADDQRASDSVIRCFGMYWQRDLVVWRGDPTILGKQLLLADAVDFGKQKGVYILYDHHTVVYVGRAIDRPLGKRLYEHTVDRLSPRWNRFSWFGLLDITAEGDLRELSLTVSSAAVGATLEALLIEALEPPQNRKRGDDFSAIEYIQEPDPAVKERQIRATLRAFEERLRAQ